MNNDLAKNFEIKTGYKFIKFYNKYRPKLVYYLTRYTKDQELAEDFADDAFTQSLLKIDNYDKEKSQIHTWIYKIAENLVKKDFKDKKKLSIISFDKDNDDNLNLINVIPGDDIDNNVMEQNKIIIKKAEIVKEAIYKLPDKYKKVMILREIENKPYLDIAEICEKKINYNLINESLKLPSIVDFLELNIINNSNELSHVNITYIDDGRKLIQLDVKPYDNFILRKDDIDKIINIEIIAKGNLIVEYKTATNLSTIKSQISKGRQLIQSMVNRKFKLIDNLDLY